MNPLTPLLTAIRDNPDVEIHKACDGSILVDVPSDGSLPVPIEIAANFPEFVIRLECNEGSTEFKVTRLAPEGCTGAITGAGDYKPVSICWINNRALSEAIAARIIADENAAQDDIIGLVKPVEEVLKGL